uniref:Uncharacterized protein n=2 Tax=Anguilla anguilla TaxID=7936 RepID=A0A0E9Q106_ANGAN
MQLLCQSMAGLLFFSQHPDSYGESSRGSIQGMQQNYSLCTESSLFHIYSLKPNKGLRDPIHKAPYIGGFLN